MTGEGQKMSLVETDGLAAAERARLESALDALAAAERQATPSDALFDRVMADAARVQASVVDTPAATPGSGAHPLPALDKGRRAGRGRLAARRSRMASPAARFGVSPGVGAAALAASLALGLFVGGFGGAAVARLAPEEATLLVADELGLRVADAGEVLFAGESPF
ncbi:MAG: hypothetical protein AAF968_06050 [Pseudomonadota bacterium]